MDRFVRMSDELERLVSHGGSDYEEAAHPPTCAPPSGPLHMRALERGGVKIEGASCALESDDFRLAVLFETGSCMFAGSDDLARFFRGPVAAAFGIDVEPLPFPPRAVSERSTTSAPIAECIAAAPTRGRARLPASSRRRPD